MNRRTEGRAPRAQPGGRLTLRSLVARVLLSAGYRAGLLAAAVGRPWRPRPVRRVLVTGTFHNPNWYRSHLRPLAACGLDALVVVTDQPPPVVEGVRVVCPPRGLRRLLGRNLAKLVTLVREARRLRPDVVMGYHLFPGALTALIAARLCGAAAIYQMTAGPIEILDGGLHAENRVMSALGRPSPRIERLALRLAKRFDGLIVRGRRAARFLHDCGVDAMVCVIPGSVRPATQTVRTHDERDLDLLWVGRLAEIKRPATFVEVVSRVARQRPGLKAALLGDGPLSDELDRRVREHRIESCVVMPGKVDPVEPWLARARVFVLTSRSEGLSIALGEAMRAGCVPVVSDVGELRDLVRDGHSGFVVDPEDIDRFADAARSVLDDPRLWRTVSEQAVRSARALMDIKQVATRWQACFARLARPDALFAPVTPREESAAASERPKELEQTASASRQTH